MLSIESTYNHKYPKCGGTKSQLITAKKLFRDKLEVHFNPTKIKLQNNKMCI